MKSEQIDRPPFFAKLVIFLVVSIIFAFVIWASFAEVDELTRGNGKVIPLSKTQVVQASEPGIVEVIAVSLGQSVKKGDLLVRLDDTTTASSLGESEARSLALKAQIARLRSEIEGLMTSEFVCPIEVASSVPRTCENERELLSIRRENFQAKYMVLQLRRKQREQELEEAHANIQRLDNLLAVISLERSKIEPLVKRKLHPEIDLIRLDREIEEQSGQRDVSVQSLERLQSAIEEATFQQDELSLQFAQEARRELSSILGELGVLDATIQGASDRVRRTDIVSPVDGVVNTLEVNTLGAFVQPGTVVAGVVPTSETLLIEAKIAPKDVAFIQPGQEALVKITAYDFSIFGGLDGVVSNVSADSIIEPETGETYYNVRVKTGNSYIEKNGLTYEIRPGMVASVEILTGSKTVLNYLLKPIVKARYEALTER